MEYPKNSAWRELARLDAFFADLLNNPDDEGLVAITDETVEKAKKQVEKIIRHMKFREFPLNRITFSIAELGEQKTILWRVPVGAKFPECENCLVMKAEDF